MYHQYHPDHLTTNSRMLFDLALGAADLGVRRGRQGTGLGPPERNKRNGGRRESLFWRRACSCTAAHLPLSCRHAVCCLQPQEGIFISSLYCSCVRSCLAKLFYLRILLPLFTYIYFSSVETVNMPEQLNSFIKHNE